MRFLPTKQILLTWLLLVAITSFTLINLSCESQNEKKLDLTVEQITFGEKHHLFGYIGQSKTIPWNASGRYIVAMRTDFHDRMPAADDAADIILIDTKDGNKVTVVDQTRAWNFQQGTMLYWNPDAAETQFFFNDRDPQSNKIFTVLYDIQKKERIREYRYPDVSIANSGVAQNGKYFLAINYGRMARLRPVTGYPETFDWTIRQNVPESDGISLIDIQTGEKKLLVSFKQLVDLINGRTFRKSKSGRLSLVSSKDAKEIENPLKPDVNKGAFYINHTLWNRNDDCIYFYLRGRYQKKSIWIDVPCTIKPDGTGLTAHSSLLGGHPEWAEDYLIIGDNNRRQVLYDVNKQEITGQLGNAEIFPKPGGDISLSPDGNWFVNGYSSDKGKNNYYVIFDRRNNAYFRTTAFSRGPYTRGELRIDQAPRWNRDNNAILVPGWTENDTRQLFVIRVIE